MESGASHASPEALQTILNYFPIILRDTDFVDAVYEALQEVGFERSNSIAVVNTCRDELAGSIALLMHEKYGPCFNICGLGGVLSAGIVGFKAAISHSPVSPDGKEKYVFFGSTHVAVDENGAEGKVLRRGRQKPSSACGAILAIKGEIENKVCQDDAMPDDNVEYTLLKRKLFSKQNLGDNPTPFELTKTVAEIITRDLENFISKTVDPTKGDYAVITGVQIHAGRHGGSWTPTSSVDYIAPVCSYVVIGGERRKLKTDGKRCFIEKQNLEENLSEST